MASPWPSRGFAIFFIKRRRLAHALLLCVGLACAQAPRIPQGGDKAWVEGEALVIVDAVAQNDFKTAFQRADGLMARFPDAPHGYMMSVFARSIYLNCYRTKSVRLQIFEHTKRVEETTKQLLKLTPGDATLKFYLGGALGYRGMLEMSEGNYFTALSTGLRAINALEDAVRDSPPVWDAYFGLALFHFTRYVYSRVLPWLSVGRDDHNNAYLYLDWVREKGLYCKHEALFRSFVFAMVDRRWEGLEAKLLAAKARFPENIYLRYRILDFYTTRELWPSVIPVARETLTLLSREAGAGVSSTFLVNAHLAHALARTGALVEAGALVRRMEQDQGNLEPWSDNPRMLELLRRTRDLLRRRQ